MNPSDAECPRCESPGHVTIRTRPTGNEAECLNDDCPVVMFTVGGYVTVEGDA